MSSPISKINVRNLASFFKEQKDAGKFRLGRDVYQDWKYTAAFFFVLNILVLAVSGYLFLQINKGELFLVERKQAIDYDTISRDQLEKVVSFYEGKLQKLNFYKRQPFEIRDPSFF